MYDITIAAYWINLIWIVHVYMYMQHSRQQFVVAGWLIGDFGPARFRDAVSRLYLHNADQYDNNHQAIKARHVETRKRVTQVAIKKIARKYIFTLL